MSQDLAELEDLEIKKALKPRFLLLTRISAIIRTAIDEEVEKLHAHIQTKLDTFDKMAQEIAVLREEMRQLKQTVQAGTLPAARTTAGENTYKVKMPNPYL